MFATAILLAVLAAILAPSTSQVTRIPEAPAGLSPSGWTSQCLEYDFKFRACDFRQKIYAYSNPTSGFNTALNPTLKGAVTWQSTLSTGARGQRTGVLKVTPLTTAQGVKIYLGLVNPQEFSFNVGDSVNNNGYGGSGPGDYWAAEIHNKGKRLYFYENAVDIQGPPVSQTYFANYFTRSFGAPMSFDLDIKKPATVAGIPLGQITASQFPPIDQAEVRFKNSRMFAFDEFYIGLNRVVQSTSRRGTGLYDVCIKFY